MYKMSIIKSFFIAFAMYSKIPVPQFKLKQEDMKYVFCFFPWVGAVIGAVFMGWYYLCKSVCMGITAYAFIGTAIPVIITGGYHVDGFMDTIDARCSYQSMEKKLCILKDSHIGAFAVIRLFLYYMIYIGALSEIKSEKTAGILAVGFVLSRAISAVAAVTMKSAKKDGSLKTVSDASSKGFVLFMLFFQILLCAVVMFLLSFWTCIMVLSGTLLCFLYYRHMAYKEFGGVTGDTAGYFLQICELAIVVFDAAGGYII